MRLLLTALVSLALLCATSAQAESPPLSPDQEKRVRELVKEYILANPEIILEAVQTLRRRQEEAKERAALEILKTRRAELFGAKDLPVAGNPDGTVTIVEFFDYRCGYCKGVKPVVDSVLRSDGKIRLVMMEFPILGPASRTASFAAIAAHKQGKYLAFHNALMAYPNNLTDDVIFALARQVGLDVPKLKEDMKAPDVQDLVERTHKLAQSLGINGTPAFVIGDRIIPGAISADELRGSVEEARKVCGERKEAYC